MEITYREASVQRGKIVCKTVCILKNKGCKYLTYSLLWWLPRDPAGIRTQDPYIKSVMLYQLSYGIMN